MALTDRSSQRSLPVRLCDIRLDVRARAARQVARESPRDAAAALGAALAPSDTTYFVAADAEPILRSVAA